MKPTCLSKASFNALLKTLEEPPPNVLFILATTEIQKSPAQRSSPVARCSSSAVSPSTGVGANICGGSATRRRSRSRPPRSIASPGPARDPYATPSRPSSRSSRSVVPVKSTTTTLLRIMGGVRSAGTDRDDPGPGPTGCRERCSRYSTDLSTRGTTSSISGASWIAALRDLLLTRNRGRLGRPADPLSRRGLSSERSR